MKGSPLSKNLSKNRKVMIPRSLNLTTTWLRLGITSLQRPTVILCLSKDKITRIISLPLKNNKRKSEVYNKIIFDFKNFPSSSYFRNKSFKSLYGRSWGSYFLLLVLVRLLEDILTILILISLGLCVRIILLPLIYFDPWKLKKIGKLNYQSGLAYRLRACNLECWCALNFRSVVF